MASRLPEAGSRRFELMEIEGAIMGDQSEKCGTLFYL
jgi:hypothetical protein